MPQRREPWTRLRTSDQMEEAGREPWVPTAGVARRVLLTLLILVAGRRLLLLLMEWMAKSGMAMKTRMMREKLMKR